MLKSPIKKNEHINTIFLYPYATRVNCLRLLDKKSVKIWKLFT